MTSGGLADPGSLRQLLDAVMSIGADLDLSAVLHRIVEAATALADADYGALGVLDPHGEHLVEFVTVGIDDATRSEIGAFPKGRGVLGLLITRPRPVRIADVTAHEASFGFPPGHPAMRSFLGVPIRLRDRVFGNLYLTNKRSAPEFSDVDEELVVALATAAGIAVENARLHAQVREVALLEDRERIAMDLHDSVIQQLFAVGLSLQGTVRLVADEEVARRVEAAVADLDVAIRDIRSAIFALSATNEAMPGGLREHILVLVDEVRPSLHGEPQVVFSGPVQAASSGVLAGDLLLVVREALSNVVRHARASCVEVDVTADDEWVTVRVIDDGIGPPEPGTRTEGRGLANLAARAERLHGSFSLRPGGGGKGTVLQWQVPR